MSKRERCCAEVPREYGVGFRQCGNWAKHFGFCGVHHPEAVARRDAKTTQKYNEDHARRMNMIDAARDHAPLLRALREMLMLHRQREKLSGITFVDARVDAAQKLLDEIDNRLKETT